MTKKPKTLRDTLKWDEKTGRPYCPECARKGKQVLMGLAGKGLSGTKRVIRYRCRCGCQKQPS